MSNADLDDLPIIRGPLRGTGEAPDVRPPSMVKRERMAREEARANGDDGPAGGGAEIEEAASDDKSLLDKVADKVAEKIEQAGEKGKVVADRLAEKIGSSGGSDDPPAR